MKRVKTLVLCLASVVGVAAVATACAEEEKHEHTYATEWSHDAEGHWYDATCECVDAPITKYSHADANNDGACDICTFTDHTHTYAEDWTVDCTNHWNAADCGHIVAGANVAAHVDENTDGECDVCKYVIEDIHVHYYDSAWSSDEAYHWHAALCEHAVEVADKDAHVLNAAGDCTVCEEHIKDVDSTSIEAVLAAAMANEYKIIDGAVIADELVYDGSGKETLINGKTNEVYFVLGNGQSYINYKSFDMNGNYMGVQDQWYQDLGNDEVFGVIRQSLATDTAELELAPTAGAAQFLKGYTYFPGSILGSDTDDTTTLANTLMGLYNIKNAGTHVSKAEENYDEETGLYSFAYEYYTVNVTYSGGEVENVQVELYVVDVEFSVDENYVIDVANFSVESYRNWEADMDLDYDLETDTVTLRSTANPTCYIYKVSQNSGVRTFTTPYPRHSLIPTDFELSYVLASEYDDMSQLVITEEELITDTLTLDEGEYTRLHLGDAYPITANFSFIDTTDFEFTFVNNNENSTGVLWKDQDFLRPVYSAYSDCITFKAADPGDYTMYVRFGSITKAINVVIAGEVVVTPPEDDANTIHVETTDTYGYFDLYSYTASASGTYTFNLPAGLGFASKNVYDGNGIPEMDFYDNANGASVEFDLAANETLEFYVGAINKANWVITVDFVAGEVGGDDDGGDEGGDEGGDVSGSVDINAIAGTYTSGTSVLVINADGTMTWDDGRYVQNYTITIDGDTVTYTLNDNAPYTADDNMAQYFGYLTFDANGMPETFVYNGTHALTVGSGDVGGDVEVVYGTEENPFVLKLGSQELEISESFVENNYYAYCALEVTQTGWYSFNGYWSYSGDVLENAEGVWIYAEAGTTLIVSKYVEVAGPMTAIVSLETMTEVSAGNGDSAANGIAIEGEGLYAINANYDVSADGVYVNFTATEAGYYSFTFSNFNNTLTYNGVEYCSNGDNGDLVLYAEVDTTYSFLLNNLDYDDNWDLVKTSGGFFFTVSTVPALTVGENTVVGSGEENTLVLILVETSGTYTITIEDKAEESIYLWGDVSVDGYSAWGTSVYSAVVELEAGTLYISTLYFPSDGNGNPLSGSWKITITEGSDVEISYDTVIVEGANTLYFSAEEVSANTAERSATITTAGDYSFNAGNLYIASVIDSTGTAVTQNEDYTYTLTAGSYTVKFGMLSMFGVSADTACELNVSNESEEEESFELGSESNPYVVTDGFSEMLGSSYSTPIFVQVNAGITASIDGDAAFYASASDYTPIGTSVTPDVDTVYCIYSNTYAGATVVLTGSIGSTGGDEEVEVSYDTVIVEGENTLFFSADEVSANTAERSATITTDGNYAFNAGNLYIASVTDSTGTAVTQNEDYTYTLSAGTYTVQFGMLSMFGVSADTACELNLENKGSSDDSAGSGTSTDPYVISELPFEVTFESTHDVYYTYTANADYTITITCPAGCFVTNNAGATKDSSGNYVFDVTAGQVVSINPWSNGGTAPYTYTITAVEKVVETPDEGEGDEGGETDGSVVTYMSEKHSSGRYLKVEIDAANGTMTLTRSNMSGGWDANTSTAEYTYAYDGTTVTAEYVSGQACTLTWNVDGTPASITWSSAEFMNFTVQA